MNSPRKNASRSGRSRMKGGSYAGDRLNEFLENLKKTITMTVYQYLFSMLLVISCVFFVFATIIFVNACINLHKTSFVYPKGENYKKLIDAPIFEFLKTNNFLVIDKFFLNADSSLKPSSIAFWTVVGIMLGTFILILIHYLVLSREEATKQKIANYHTGLKENYPYLLIAAFPYLFIFIIVITFNSIQVKNMGELNNIKISSITEYKKADLDIIKEKLQKIIYENDATLTTAKLLDMFKSYEKPSIDAAAAAANANADAPEVPVVPIDIEAIVFIYKHNITSLGKTGDPLKQYQRKYINYIDEYFNLLKYNSGGTGADNNYTKFYLFGLIEYKDGDNANPSYTGKIKEYRELIKNNDTGGGLEELLKSYIASNTRGIRCYFLTVISLYTILCVFTIIILLIYNQDVKMPFLTLLFIIKKYIPIETILKSIGVLLVLSGLIALIFYIIFPQMYKWGIGVIYWFNYTSK
jgi:hypothetical protein